MAEIYTKYMKMLKLTMPIYFNSFPPDFLKTYFSTVHGPTASLIESPMLAYK